MAEGFVTALARLWHGRSVRFGLPTGRITIFPKVDLNAMIEEERKGMHKTVQRESEALRGHQKRIEEMRRHRGALLDNSARIAPEALNELTPEERHQVYRMLRLRVVITMYGGLEINGAFGKGAGFCPMETRS